VISHSLVAAAGRHRDPNKAISAARSLRRTELAKYRLRLTCSVSSTPRRSAGHCPTMWDAVLEAALRAEIKAWEDEHHRNAPALISVIGMGRLGGAELSYGSDADVMFVCEADRRTPMDRRGFQRR
jgi:glutamate-ammonia-ligase adenylyltransferase